MTTATITRSTLSPFVTAAITKMAVGERAVKAAEIVLAGQIQRLADVDGEDRWAVQGSAPRPYEVSIKGAYCQCQDAAHAAPKSPKGAPLCKHMLAAMYLVKAGVSRGPTAGELFARLVEHGQPLRIFVRQAWTGTTTQIQRDQWTAYRLPDGERVELAEPLDVSMDQDGFWSAVEAAGLRRASQQRSHGGQHLWTFEAAPVAVTNWPKIGQLVNDGEYLNRDEDGMLWA